MDIRAKIQQVSFPDVKYNLGLGKKREREREREREVGFIAGHSLTESK